MCWFKHSSVWFSFDTIAYTHIKEKCSMPTKFEKCLHHSMFHVCGYTGKTNRISHKRAKRVSWHTIKRCDFFRKFDRNTQVQKKHSKAWFIAPISWRPCKLPTWLKIWKWMITKLWSSINFIYASVSRHIALEDIDHNSMLFWYSEIWILWFIITKVARLGIICKYHVFIIV